MTSEEEESLKILAIQSALSWAEVRFQQLSATTKSSSHIQRVSPASLAYLGDAVYELYIRTCYLLPPRRLGDYHQQVVSQVRAESQAKTLRSLEPYLTASELEILRRGRNAATGHPRRLDPKIYQQATSLETLLGYLYLTDPQRLTQLLAHLDLDPR
ncbi:Mini-ribonuclease 3 [Allocoleopsis sp.]|uniref:Mini-ribonuclease 3 n=1 Tax=Allocoleopsis sp. TaxID=3088169 RepID=UPI002FD4782D